MKVRVQVGERTIEVDTDQLDAVMQVEPGVFSVLVEGASYEIRAIPSRQGLSLEANSHRFPVEVSDPRDAAKTARRTRATGRQNIAAPMPGKVVRVLVQEGETVEAGHGLVVVEAMKMQNEMKASRPGRVAEIRVRDGDTVGANDTLVVLE